MASPVGRTHYGTASRTVRAAVASDAAAAIAAGSSGLSDEEAARRISRRHSMPHAVVRQLAQDGAAMTAREVGKVMAVLGAPVSRHEARRIVTRFPGTPGGGAKGGEATANFGEYLASLGMRGETAAAAGGGEAAADAPTATHTSGGGPASPSGGDGGSSRFLAFGSDGVVLAPLGMRADRAVRARPNRSRSLSPRAPVHRAHHDTLEFQDGAVVSSAGEMLLGRGPKNGGRWGRRR